MRDWYSEFETYTLPNGLQIQQLHMPDAPMQHVAFILGSGTYHTRDIPGLAHFAEHIVANSAGAVKLGKEMKEQGGYLVGGGGSTGAYTTCYGFGLLAHHAGFCSLLELHRRYIFENCLSWDVEGEKGPFTAEFNLRFPTQRKLAGHYLAYRAMRSGDWYTPAIGFGTEEGISAFTLPQVQQFYAEHYTPANLQPILTVGPHTRESFTRLMETSGWASLPITGQAQAMSPQPYPVHAPRMEPFCDIDPENTACDSAHMAYLPPGFPRATVVLLCDIIAEHIQDALRQKSRLVYSTQASMCRQPTYLELAITASGVPASKSDAFYQAYMAAHSDIVSGRIITEEKVARAKSIACIGVRTQELTSRTVFRTAQNYLMDKLPVMTDAQWLKEVETVTPQQLREAAAAFHFDRSFFAMGLCPGASLPVGLPRYDIITANAALREGRPPPPALSSDISI